MSALPITTPRPTSRKQRALKESLDFARTTIKEKIDLERKYVPDALYEMTGEKLREYLAFAYREGITRKALGVRS